MVKKKRKLVSKKISVVSSPKFLFLAGLLLVVTLLFSKHLLRMNADFPLKAETINSVIPSFSPSTEPSPTIENQQVETTNPVALPTSTPTRTPNPTVSSEFAPITPYNLLFGQITSADCNGISGFTFEVSNGGTTDFLIMKQDPGGGGLGIGGSANLPSSDVNEHYKISSNHRFTHELPGVMDGKKYQYRVYAEGAGTEFELVGSPIELQCP